jgi:hypothetical protein
MAPTWDEHISSEKSAQPHFNVLRSLWEYELGLPVAIGSLDGGIIEGTVCVISCNVALEIRVAGVGRTLALSD